MELTEFRGGDPTLFAVDNPTPPQNQIKSVRVDEATVRRLASDPEIPWPAAENPPTTGKCSVYLSADRAGHVREVWPGDCDNAGLQGFLARDGKKMAAKTGYRKRHTGADRSLGELYVRKETDQQSSFGQYPQPERTDFNVGR